MDSPAGRERLALSGPLLLVILLVAVLSGAAVAVVDRALLDAPAGEQGPAGPAGDAAELDSEQVWEVIEADSERLAGLLDPTPSDLDGRVGDLDGRVGELADEVQQATSDTEDVASNLTSFCSSLSLTDALSSDALSCP